MGTGLLLLFDAPCLGCPPPSGEAERDGGLQVGAKQRVRRLGTRGELRHVERGQEETAIGQLDDPNLSLRAQARDDERSPSQPIPVDGVETIAAAKGLHRRPAAIRSMRPRAGHELHALLLPDERAGQLADHELCGIRRGLFVLRVAQSQYVPRILYQSMLEATSGANKGPVALPGKTDGSERTLHALVRAARGAPQRVTRLQERSAARLVKRRGREPGDLEGNVQCVRSVNQRVVGGDVRAARRIPIPDDADPQPISHFTPHRSVTLPQRAGLPVVGV